MRRTRGEKRPIPDLRGLVVRSDFQSRAEGRVHPTAQVALRVGPSVVCYGLILVRIQCQTALDVGCGRSMIMIYMIGQTGGQEWRRNLRFDWA